MKANDLVSHELHGVLLVDVEQVAADLELHVLDTVVHREAAAERHPARLEALQLDASSSSSSAERRGGEEVKEGGGGAKDEGGGGGAAVGGAKGESTTLSTSSPSSSPSSSNEGKPPWRQVAPLRGFLLGLAP
eukprot:scaffold238623_cov17-Tisochrysis_lutea.AAC.1